MVSYTVSHQAYLKIALHAAKYPHKQVNGVLLGEGKGETVAIVDAIPLLHHWTSLSPIMEIGLDLAGKHAESFQLHLVGYYQVSDRIDEIALGLVGERIASTIKKGFANTVAFVVNANNLATAKSALVPYLCQDNSAIWRPALNSAPTLQMAASPSRVIELIRNEKLYEKFGDFDDHLEDVSIDWLRNSDCKDLSFAG